MIFSPPPDKPAEEYALPIEALIIFLDDKGVDLIAKELERMYYEDHTDNISRQEFLNVVTTILSSLDDGELQPIAEETEQPQSIDRSYSKNRMRSQCCRPNLMKPTRDSSDLFTPIPKPVTM
jgi:hypothetical protein